MVQVLIQNNLILSEIWEEEIQKFKNLHLLDLKLHFKENKQNHGFEPRRRPQTKHVSEFYTSLELALH